MPEREITEEQLRAVCDWVRSKSRDALLVPLFPSRVGRVYRVDDEPLVVQPYPKGVRLLCSDKRAKELEEAGIVNFSETPQSTS